MRLHGVRRRTHVPDVVAARLHVHCAQAQRHRHRDACRRSTPLFGPLHLWSQGSLSHLLLHSIGYHFSCRHSRVHS